MISTNLELDLYIGDGLRLFHRAGFRVCFAALPFPEHLVGDEMRSSGLWGQLLGISFKFYPAGIIVKPDKPKI